MARAGLTRLDVKRARDSLIAQGQHASIDAIRIALGNTGSKTTIHRYLKELEEEDGTSLVRAAALSDAIQDLVARLAARLHEEAQALVDQQVAAAAVQRQQAQSEIAKLGAELATVREQLSGATATLSAEQDAHAETLLVLHQRDLDVERLDGGTINLSQDGGPFHRLDVGTLSGNGTFGMHVDLAALQGDFLNVSGTASGDHGLAIKNTGVEPTKGADPLQVVQTAGGNATF